MASQVARQRQRKGTIQVSSVRSRSETDSVVKVAIAGLPASGNG